MVNIDGYQVETCHCGSGNISIKKQPLPPKNVVEMYRMTCDRCGDGPNAYKFIPGIMNHYKVWNTYIKKIKRRRGES